MANKSDSKKKSKSPRNKTVESDENQIKLKSALVSTRKTIAKKFRKLHKERSNQERVLAEKYTPIADSINNLIDSKQKLISEKNIIAKHSGELKNELQNIDLKPNVSSQNIKNEFDLPPLSETSESEMDLEINDVEKTVNQDKTSASDLEFNVDENKCFGKRKKVSNLNPFIKKKLVDREKQKKKITQLNTLHDIREGGLELFKRKKMKTEKDLNAETPKRISKEHKKFKALCLEDFDDVGNYVGKKAKRRKVAIYDQPNLPLKFRIKNIKTTQRKRSNVLKSGTGLETNFIPYKENIAYEYYDDPNELCERLRLLISSKSAGNSNHDQEINSIIEELRESDVIE